VTNKFGAYVVIFRRSDKDDEQPLPPMLCLLVIVTILIGEAYADTFEFLTYTPPRGWVKQALQDGSAYRRASGRGGIMLPAVSGSNGNQ
jgi:hypothetical protein